VCARATPVSKFLQVQAIVISEIQMMDISKVFRSSLPPNRLMQRMMMPTTLKGLKMANQDAWRTSSAQLLGGMPHGQIQNTVESQKVFITNRSGRRVLIL
jgi:hypothetical protein